MDVREQRVKFVVAASRREKPFSTLCEEFGISRPTGQLWLQRNRETGVEGIANAVGDRITVHGKPPADWKSRW